MSRSEMEITKGAKKLGVAAFGVIIILVIIFGHHCLVEPTPYQSAPIGQQQGK